MRSFRAILIAGALGVVACKDGSGRPPGATLLFDVDFSAPANSVGAAPKVYEDGAEQAVPSLLPSLIFLGAPQVVEKLCGLADQPAAFATATGQQGHSGLEFLLDQRFGRYHVELDVCIASLGVPPLQANEPQLAIFLDIPDAYALGFFERGRLVVVEPSRGTDVVTDPKVIGAWLPDKPMRIALDFDLVKQVWSIAVDGAKVFDGVLVEASLPRAVRVVIRGNKSNVAAIDNLEIWAENDRSQELLELPVEPASAEEPPQENAE